MVSMLFDDLLDELDDEHKHQLAVIKDLKLENDSLRAQLGLGASPCIPEQRQYIANSHCRRSRHRVAKERSLCFHRRPCRALVSDDDLPKPFTGDHNMSEHSSDSLLDDEGTNSGKPRVKLSKLVEVPPESPTRSPARISFSKSTETRLSFKSIESSRSTESSIRSALKGQKSKSKMSSSNSDSDTATADRNYKKRLSFGVVVYESNDEKDKDLDSETDIGMVNTNDSEKSMEIQDTASADTLVENMNTSASERFIRQVGDLHDVWKAGEPQELQSRPSRKTIKQNEPIMNVEAATGIGYQENNTWCQRIVMRPNSKKRLSWDLLTIAMVGWDVATVPLLVFDMGDTDFTYIMNWMTTLFWTMDLPCSFLTGFHMEGMVEMRPFAIAKKYIMSWLFFDLIVVSTDWFFMVLAQQDKDAVGLLRFGKAGRFSRLLRALRLLRFMKLQRTLCEMLELIKSDYVSTLTNVLLSILFIITLNHYIACGWYFMGSMYKNDGLPNWIEEAGVSSRRIIYRYATAMHWSLTQFTPASMEVRPYNLGERFYSIIVLLFALITFSSFLGSITTAMTALRRSRSEQARQQSLLRRYFDDNNVSNELNQRIWKFIKNTHFGHRSRTRTCDVPIIKELPSTLRNSLNQELYRPFVTRIPVFEYYLTLEGDGLAELCHKAVIEQSLVSGDEAFCAGQDADKLFIVSNGSMSYKLATTLESVELAVGAWVCEQVIWFKWVHGGNLTALMACECFTMSGQACRSIMAKYITSKPCLQAYATEFAKYEAGHSGDEWGSDLRMNLVELEEVINKATNETSDELEQNFSQNSTNLGFQKLFSLPLAKPRRQMNKFFHKLQKGGAYNSEGSKGLSKSERASTK